MISYLNKLYPMAKQKHIFPLRDECVYTQYYCEENVWKLCEKMNEMNGNLDDVYVVFITSKAKATPVFCMRIQTDDDLPLLWDYHVILIAKDEETFYAFDFDATLPTPSPVREYLLNVIRSEENLNPANKRIFRIIPASVYLTKFSSDRSHMKNEKGEFLSKPPNYPPIMPAGLENNFQDFISVSEEVGIGIVTDYQGFIEHFRYKDCNF